MRHRIRYSIITALMVSFLQTASGPVLAGQMNSEPLYGETADQLLAAGLREQYTYALLQCITSTGPRLAGSKGAAAAVELTRRIMQDLGFDAVHLEPTQVPHWERGPEAFAQMISSKAGSSPLSVAAIGGSIGTPEAGISGNVLEVRSFAELHKKRDQVPGRIVFFNRPMDSALLNTFSAYGGAANQRTQGAVEAARAGAIAVLVRSLTMRLDDFPHTGMLEYVLDRATPIPAACVSTLGAEHLHSALQEDPNLRVEMRFQCRRLEPAPSHNVVGQITGRDKPQEIILLGGHLDCWDLSHGAHDDGAGCAQAIAALRLLRKLGLTPRRTIRAVMFMNEEFGGSGGRDYAVSGLRDQETHVAALESDRGGFLPLAIGLGLSQGEFDGFRKWEELFRRVGLQRLQRGGGGVDIGPLGSQGTILCSLIPDSQRYFDVHHSAKDVLTAVNPRELELGTIAMALWAYIIAEEGI
ncbi:MAG: M20/M25/M40 family metallo-hydrolase [Candidatus Aminicenantaceae bacterium]